MKKLVLIILILFAGTWYFFLHKPTNPIASLNSPFPSSSPVVDKTEEETTFGTPIRFQIPELGVDTRVEEVGMDIKGNMDVPKDPNNVAWYKLGHKIGSNGSAVIAAHFDKPDGSPAVFYRLNQLTTGDSIKVSDENGNTEVYTVSETKEYPYDEFPLQEVFNTTDTSRLNLITCDGTWDKVKKTYAKRLVVYSKLSS